MRNYLTQHASYAVLALTTLFSAASQANLLTNPSFEEPALAPNTWSIFKSIPGWESTIGDGIEVQNRVAGNPSDGFQHVELASNNPSNMFQDVVTTENLFYDLSFVYSPRPGSRSGDNAIEVFWDNQLVDTLTATGVGLNNTDWELFEFQLQASTELTRLEFRDASNGSSSFGGYLDNVSLTVAEPVPTASALILMLPLLWRLRRYKKY